MTFEEIESLKADCPDRAVIVSSVIEGSSTFETKSAYSQLKYVTRKRRKFLQYVHVSHTSIRTLCAYHISRDPRRALDLRLDSLSLILALGNVQPANFSGTSSKILVWDESHGLLTGSILSKVMSGKFTNFLKNRKKLSLSSIRFELTFKIQIFVNLIN